MKLALAAILPVIYCLTPSCIHPDGYFVTSITSYADQKAETCTQYGGYAVPPLENIRATLSIITDCVGTQQFVWVNFVDSAGGDCHALSVDNGLLERSCYARFPVLCKLGNPPTGGLPDGGMFSHDSTSSEEECFWA